VPCPGFGVCEGGSGFESDDLDAGVFGRPAKGVSGRSCSSFTSGTAVAAPGLTVLTEGIAVVCELS